MLPEGDTHLLNRIKLYPDERQPPTCCICSLDLELGLSGCRCPDDPSRQHGLARHYTTLSRPHAFKPQAQRVRSQDGLGSRYGFANAEAAPVQCLASSLLARVGCWLVLAACLPCARLSSSSSLSHVHHEHKPVTHTPLPARASVLALDAGAKRQLPNLIGLI